MKIILEFGHDEETLADQSYKGPKYAQAVEEFGSHLRNKVKYGNLSGDAQREVDDLYNYFYIIFRGLINE